MDLCLWPQPSILRDPAIGRTCAVSNQELELARERMRTRGKVRLARCLLGHSYAHHNLGFPAGFGHLHKFHAYPRDAIDASTGCEVLHAGHFSSVLLFVSYNSLLCGIYLINTAFLPPYLKRPDGEQNYKIFSHAICGGQRSCTFLRPVF